MPRYSNITIGKDKATMHNAMHNNRTIEPPYLISRNKKHYWVDVNCKAVEKSLNLLLKKVSKNRKALSKKIISTQTHVMKEFVINLDRYHTQKVMYEIGNYLKRYNFTILQKAVHFDEGVFLKKINVPTQDWNLKDYLYDSDRKKWIDKDGKVVLDIIVYQPNINIFWDKKSEKWYHDRAYQKALDMTTVKKKINYHGHILVLNLDEEGNSIARTLRPHLSKIQKDIALITKMPIKSTTNRRKGQKHMDYKHSAALSAKEDEMKRKNMVLYNQNQFLLEQFGRLDPEILKIKNIKDKHNLVKKAVPNMMGWKIFAVEQYKLLGFTYERGDKIHKKDALKEIEKNLESEQNFITEIFKIFGISKNISYEETLKVLEKIGSNQYGIKSIL